MISQPFPQASLWFVSGPLAQQTIPITAQETWIGGNPGNHIRISDQSIQPWHARLSWDTNGLIIQNYENSPVTVNRQIIPGAAYLQHGDEVALGQAGIAFRVVNTALSPQSDSHATIQYSGSYAAASQSDSHTTVQPKNETSATPQPAKGLQQTGSHTTPQPLGISTTPQPSDAAQQDFETATLQGDILATVQQQFEALSREKALPQNDSSATPSKGLKAVSSQSGAVATPSKGFRAVITQSGAIVTPSKSLKTAPVQQDPVSTPSQPFEAVSSPNEAISTPQRGFTVAASQQSGVHSTSLRDFRTGAQQEDANTMPQPAVKVQRPPEAQQNSGSVISQIAEVFPASAQTEITRYLCAAAHLDETFRDYVLKRIVSEEHKSLGETYGVDLVPVVKWSLAAQKRAFIRDIVLCAILLGMLLFWLTSFILWSRSSPVNPYTIPGFSFGSTFLINITYVVLSSANLVTLLPLVLILQFLVVTVLVAAVHFARPSLRRGTLYLIAYLLLFPTFLLPFYVLAWIAVIVEKSLACYGAVAARLTKGKFRSDTIQVPLDASLERRLRESSIQDGNVVVYSGDLPFAGAGIRTGGWSFTLDISKGKVVSGTSLSPESFQVSEMYAYVADLLKGLSLDEQHELLLTEKLYVNGREIRTDRRFLDNPFAHPYTQVAPLLLQEYMERPTQDIHYYKCVRVTSWREDLLASIFFRFVLTGKTLFIEADNLVLPPLKERYYQIDTLEPTPTVGKLWELTQQSFVPTFQSLLHAPARVISWLLRDWLAQQKRQRTMRFIKDNATFDYGAASNLREVASANEDRRSFQQLDKAMYMKIIERELLEGIVKFLDSKNIATAALRKRKEIGLARKLRQ